MCAGTTALEQESRQYQPQHSRESRRVSWGVWGRARHIAGPAITGVVIDQLRSGSVLFGMAAGRGAAIGLRRTGETTAGGAMDAGAATRVGRAIGRRARADARGVRVGGARGVASGRARTRYVKRPARHPAHCAADSVGALRCPAVSRLHAGGVGVLDDATGSFSAGGYLMTHVARLVQSAVRATAYARYAGTRLVCSGAGDRAVRLADFLRSPAGHV